MHLVKVQDNWQVVCGRVHREVAEQMQSWCWQTWGSGWGEYRTNLGVSIFTFSTSTQANWFLVRWQDHFKKVDKNP